MYKSFDTLLLRIPAFSANVIELISNNGGFPLWLLNNDVFKCAIYFASPELYQELNKYLTGKMKPEEKLRTERSLLKYLVRMSSRCTPFGLFAACAPCQLGENTNLKPKEQYRINIRFDMFYLCSLAQYISRDNAIKWKLRYQPNTTLYSCGNKYHYIEYYYKGEQRVFQLVEIIRTRLLNSILRFARQGFDLNQIQQNILNIYDVEQTKIRFYIEELVENQFLVSELEPIITGKKDFFSVIVDVVSNLIPDSELCKKLCGISEMLKEINGNRISVTEENSIIECCNKIKDSVSQLGVAFKDKYLFQVDVIREMQAATVGKSVVDKLEKGFEVLSRISQNMFSHSLNDFISTFSSRYEGQEVPLMEVLNPEIGIGYPVKRKYFQEPLLAGLKLPSSNKKGSKQVMMSPLISLLQQKLVCFDSLTDDGIHLTKQDLESFPNVQSDLQETVSLMFELLCTVSEQNEKQTVLIKTVGGGSGANLLARFAYCDERIESLVHEIVDYDAKIYSDSIVAEIVHIPNSRIGNVLARPTLRSHEIVYLANTTRKRENVIYPEDLMVSVRGNRIFLRSKSRNKYIYPKLTTAHNYYNDPTPLYRFLCELQHQGKRSALSFSWGCLEQSLSFLPRVYYEDILLSACRWHLKTDEVKKWRTINEDSILLATVQKWLQLNHIPQYTYLCEGDNRLLINWGCAKIVRIFLDEVCRRMDFTLEEAFNISSSDIVNESGGYTNECIAIFHRN